MEFISNIEKEEYGDFVKHHKKSHFMQSYEWGEFSYKNKNLIPHYVGLKDKKGLRAAALLLQKKLPLGYSYFYSPRGYVIDFDNKDLLKEFTNKLKEYAKKNKAIYIKIDPDIKLQDLNEDGLVINKESNNYELVNYLKSIGYKHHGFNKNFENSEPRYTFRLNLDKDINEITDGFHPTTKKIIKKGNPYNLELYKNDKANIKDFYITMEETAKREQILNHDIDYYNNFYKYLHENNMSDLYVVKLNVKNLKQDYENKINTINKQIETIKSPNKKQEYINQLNKILKEKKELDEIKDDEIVLSSIITAKYNDKIWTVHGGNHTYLRSLNANYFVYFEIIKDSNKERYKKIDFFGTTGNPTKDNPVYGIHLFKKRLGGEYTEFIGEFDLITNKPVYYIFETLVPIYRKIKRQIKKKELIK